MNNPEKLANTIVHLAHENARLSMEVSILKSEINILNEKLDAERETFLNAVLPPSKTNPDNDEWGAAPDDDEWYCKVCGGEFPPDDDEQREDRLPCKGIAPVCYMVDPPSGWKYGFPKLYKCWPEEGQPPADLDWWLEQNGYPAHEIRLWQNSPKYGCVPCRVWKHES